MRTYLHELRLTGVRCLRCHVEFDLDEPHPVSAEMVNGYPAVCRHTGRTAFAFEYTDLWFEMVNKMMSKEVFL